MIAIKSTTGSFYFYSVKNLAFLGTLKIKGEVNTDPDFYYDEKANKIYGIVIKGLDEYLYELSPEQLEYTLIPLVKEVSQAQNEKMITRYILHKSDQEGIYLIRDVYGIGGRKTPNIYKCSYGRYKKEGKALRLQEEYLSTNEYHLKLLDIIEQKSYRRFLEYCKKHCINSTFIKYYRKDCDLYFITNKAVYQENQTGNFQEIYCAEYMSDYAEFQGRRYICTWNWCLVQGIANKYLKK